MKISFAKLVKSDYLSLLLLIVPIVGVLLFLDTKYFGVLRHFIGRAEAAQGGNPMFFVYLAVFGVVICLPLLRYRYKKIAHHFASGVEVQGRIVDLYFQKDRGRVTFSYSFQGSEYAVDNAVHRSAIVQTFKVGYPVTVVVSPSNPRKAYIKALYIAD